MIVPSSVRGRYIAVAFLACLFFPIRAAIPCVAQTTQATPGDAPQQTIAEKIAASKDLLDINTATPAQLKALPGMGNAYVARVIAGRPYTAKNQLTTRGILPADEYEKIKPLIIAHRPKP
jgi:DNA uptake protein ComE-like DNA-binding protein